MNQSFFFNIKTRQIRRRFKTRYFVTILMISTLYYASVVFDPIALHQLIEVGLAGEIVISLLVHAHKKDTVRG